MTQIQLEQDEVLRISSDDLGEFFFIPSGSVSREQSETQLG